MPIYEIDGVRPEFPGAGNYWIAENAVLIGRVRLKHEASVWWGSVLRGDNEWIELGERSQIQDNVMLHTDPGFPITIGANCVIGHNVVLHGCKIEDRCLIGMGSILLNGVVVGSGSIIAAGTLLPEKTVVEPNSLWMGSPGKFRRKLDESDQAMILRYAENYIGYKKAYLLERK